MPTLPLPLYPVIQGLCALPWGTGFKPSKARPLFTQQSRQEVVGYCHATLASLIINHM